jgi:hypothetical protein
MRVGRASPILGHWPIKMTAPSGLWFPEILFSRPSQNVNTPTVSYWSLLHHIREDVGVVHVHSSHGFDYNRYIALTSPIIILGGIYTKQT